jgi:uncharacterized membrane protein
VLDALRLQNKDVFHLHVIKLIVKLASKIHYLAGIVMLISEKFPSQVINEVSISTLIRAFMPLY